MGGCGGSGCRAGSTRVNLAEGEAQAQPLGHPTAQTDCCITGTQGQRPELVAWVGGSNVVEPGAHISELHKAPFVPCPRVHRGSA